MWPLLVCISDWNKNILSSFVEDHPLKCRSESVEVFLLFVYICIIVGRSNYQEFNPPHLCACLKPDSALFKLAFHKTSDQTKEF